MSFSFCIFCEKWSLILCLNELILSVDWLENFISISGSHSFEKFHYIYTCMLINSVLLGKPIYSFELYSPKMCCVFLIQVEANTFVLC